MKSKVQPTPWYGLVTVWTFPMLFLDLIFMTIYVILLLPGFLQMAWFYATTNRIAVQYKLDSCRNSLDVYPLGKAHQYYQSQHHAQTKRPVVVFLPGGAYMIGYKMWATLLAQALVPAGILVIAADYRNYPFGTVPAMIQDVEDVLQWAFEHCDDYGGDPNQIILVGQSAGAHLGMMSVLRRRWNIKGFLGLSGVYDMREITRNFAKHGLSHDFVQQCLFQNRMDECDPTILISLEEKTMPLLPPIELWHGTGDKTAPWQGSREFAFKLEPYSKQVHFKAYLNWTHTDAIIEAIFEGNHAFHRDLCSCIQKWCMIQIDFRRPPASPWCPQVLVQLARKVSPF